MHHKKESAFSIDNHCNLDQTLSMYKSMCKRTLEFGLQVYYRAVMIKFKLLIKNINAKMYPLYILLNEITTLILCYKI